MIWTHPLGTSIALHPLRTMARLTETQKTGNRYNCTRNSPHAQAMWCLSKNGLSQNPVFPPISLTRAVLIFHDQFCMFQLIEPSDIQLLLLRLPLCSCCCCWGCTLWRLGLLLLLHLRLLLPLLHNSQQARCFHGLVRLSEQ